jgi:hypothetical protein
MTPRARRIALLVSCVAPLTPLAEARADDEATTYFKVIVDEAPVRSGAHHSFYPFATVEAGDIVEVTGEREGWARVLTAGPAFDDAVGYVKYSTARTDRIRMLEDGDFAMTLGLTAIIAPNLNSPDPAESWRTIHRMPAGAEIEVIETIQVDRDTIHTVALPPEAVGWINTIELAPADDVEVEAWLAAERAAVEALVEAEPPAPTPVQDPVGSDLLVGIADPGTPGDGVALATPEELLPPPDEVVIEEPIEVIPSAEGEVLVMGAESEAEAEALTEELESDVAEEMEVEAAADADVEDARPSIDDLDAALERLALDDLATAELDPLIALYEELAITTESDREARYAEARLEQLRVWKELQERQARIAAVRARVREQGLTARATRLELEASGSYSAVGRVTPSSIYDGVRLPRLLRIQDPATGRTIAYVQPSETFDWGGMLGALVGIVGPKHYEGSLGLNLVDARRVEVLSATYELDGTAP